MRNSIFVFAILVLFIVILFYCAKSEKPGSGETSEQMEEATADTTVFPDEEEAEEMGSGDDPIEIIYPDKNDTTK